MSGDLISRNALFEMLNYNKAIHEDESGEIRQLIAVDINKMIEYVEKMPTAYDVDKVVEQLEELKNESNMLTAKCSANIIAVSALRKAIEIVKAGGVE